MKILVIGSRVPWPLHDGGAIATYRMLRSLSSAGNEVTYFTFNTIKHWVPDEVISREFSFCKVITSKLDASVRFIPALMSLLGGKNYNLSRFHSAESQAKLADLLKKETFDLVHFESLFTIDFFQVVQLHSSSVKVLRAHNTEYSIWEKLAENSRGILKRWYLRKLSSGLKKEEISAWKKFDAILPISATDELLIRKTISNQEIKLIPVPVEIETNNQSVQHIPDSICHLGSMEWIPNTEGVSWFIKNVLPELRNIKPEITFHIAGKSLKKSDPRFIAEGVVNHGQVENAAEFIRQFSLAIVPLFSGSGIRIKTLESMAAGVPVISTGIGAEGIKVQDNNPVFIAEGKEEWISAILLLLSDKNRLNEMKQNGLDYIGKHYSEESIGLQLTEYYKKLIGKV